MQKEPRLARIVEDAEIDDSGTRRWQFSRSCEDQSQLPTARRPVRLIRADQHIYILRRSAASEIEQVRSGLEIKIHARWERNAPVNLVPVRHQGIGRLGD